MRLKTFYKAPIEVELSDEEQYELVGEILREHYNENYDILEDNDRECMSRVHTYFTGKPIDYLER